MSDDNDAALSTGDGGKPVDPVEKQTDPALAALQNARKSAKKRDLSPRRRRGGSSADGRRSGYSGPGADPRDPQRLGDVLAGYTAEREWQRPLAEARLFADWGALVGPDIAAHCTPVGLHDGELRVSAESTAWATQLRLLSSSVLARLAGELGPGIVAKIIFTGPSGPSWKKGPWSMYRGRGPRDTYG